MRAIQFSIAKLKSRIPDTKTNKLRMRASDLESLYLDRNTTMTWENEIDDTSELATTLEDDASQRLGPISDASWAEGIYKVLQHDEGKLSGSLVQFTSTCIADGENLKFVENVRVIPPQHMLKYVQPTMYPILKDPPRRWSYEERSGCLEHISCTQSGQTDSACSDNGEPCAYIERTCPKKRKRDTDTTPKLWRSPAANVRKISRHLVREPLKWFTNK